MKRHRIIAAICFVMFASIFGGCAASRLTQINNDMAVLVKERLSQMQAGDLELADSVVALASLYYEPVEPVRIRCGFGNKAEDKVAAALVVAEVKRVRDMLLAGAKKNSGRDACDQAEKTRLGCFMGDSAMLAYLLGEDQASREIIRLAFNSGLIVGSEKMCAHRRSKLYVIETPVGVLAEWPVNATEDKAFLHIRNTLISVHTSQSGL
jgi:hypothetical protein